MKRKNLVFIMMDQLRYDALSCHGNPVIQTPALDRLAASGVSFSQYFANAPVCVPSRCSLFTGRYLHCHQVRENHTLLEPGREIHLFRALKQAGYALGYMGKNHLLADTEFQNFDCTDVENFDHQLTPEEAEYKAFGKQCHHQMDLRGCWAGTGYFDLPPKAPSVCRYTDSACQFVREQTDPFALCLSILEPHAPHIAPIEFEALYQQAVRQLPEASVEELEQKARRYCIKYFAQQSDKAEETDKKRYIATYYAMVTFVDQQIGRLLDVLEESGHREDTLVVFTSDHGDFLFDHGMCKKDLVLCDSLLHVPLILSCPGQLPEGRKAELLAEEVDVMPTILDLLGLPVPFGVQGRSLLPALKGEIAHKEAVFAEVCPPWLYNPFPDYESFARYWLEEQRRSFVPFNVPGDYTKSIRTADYRYVWYGTGEEELYDLKNDPGERQNLAAEPDRQQLKNQLKLQLLEWCALSEEPLDPALRLELQQQYNCWKTDRLDSPAQGSPYWMAYRFRQNSEDKK